MTDVYAGLAVATVIQLTHSALRCPARDPAKLDLSPLMYYEFDPDAAQFAGM